MTATTDRVVTAEGLRRLAGACSLLALAALIGACSALQPASVEPPRLHVLDGRPAAAPAAERRELVIEVSAPKARPGFDTPQIAYVQKPHAIEYYANHRWAEAPARMLGPLLVQTLEETGAFRAVVQPPAAVPVDVRVVTELTRVQQNFETRPSRADVAVHVQLLDVRSRRVLSTRTFDATEDAASDDAYGGVVALNRAIARVLAQISAFTITESAAVRPGGPLSP